MTLHSFVRPAPQLLFAPARDGYGVRLALVFGNHAPAGKCPRYLAGACRHCDIGAGEGVAFTPALNRRRLAWFQDHYREILPHVEHLVLYNSGSLLDPREMPAALCDEILAWTQTLPRLQVVSLETREQEAMAAALRRAACAVGAGRTVRAVLGLETANDHVRNTVLGKAMPRKAVEQVAQAIRAATADPQTTRIGLTLNILIGGPGIAVPDVLDDALATAEFALQTSRDSGVAVDLNLHPYYRSVRGQAHFPDHQRCSPQTVARVAAAVAQLIAHHALPCVLFIGDSDEGHDVDTLSSASSENAASEVFAAFNRTQDHAVLSALCAGPTVREND